MPDYPFYRDPDLRLVPGLEGARPAMSAGRTDKGATIRKLELMFGPRLHSVVSRCFQSGVSAAVARMEAHRLARLGWEREAEIVADCAEALAVAAHIRARRGQWSARSTP